MVLRVGCESVVGASRSIERERNKKSSHTISHSNTGINRKVQLKPKKWSFEKGKDGMPRRVATEVLLVLKWGGVSVQLDSTPTPLFLHSNTTHAFEFKHSSNYHRFSRNEVSFKRLTSVTHFDRPCIQTMMCWDLDCCVFTARSDMISRFTPVMRDDVS